MKRINEIFYSIQGEGFYTGTPAVFVRFAGCNLICRFCDTKHEAYTEMSDEEIVQKVSEYPCSHVILTGGEPSLQTTSSLVNALKRAGKYVSMETNGIKEVPNEIDWVTVSPKGNYKIKARINELKIVFNGDVNLEPHEKAPLANMYLQPLSGENIQEVIEYVKENPIWKLSLQTHKLVGIE